MRWDDVALGKQPPSSGTWCKTVRSLFRHGGRTALLIYMCMHNGLQREKHKPAYTAYGDSVCNTDMAKKSKDGLRDIARARPDKIARREIRGPRRTVHNIKAESVMLTVD